jgi:hypothetical protein
MHFTRKVRLAVVQLDHRSGDERVSSNSALNAGTDLKAKGTAFVLLSVVGRYHHFDVDWFDIDVAKE